MAIETANGEIPAVALAPMAVLPAHQGKQVGTRLINAGLEKLRARGERIVLVLGHEHYYPRFGFSSAKAATLTSPFPPEAYMALELAEGALDQVSGKVRYPAAFGL
jgi:putative acetyltransferase